MATKGDINATVGIGIKTEQGALKGLNDQINTLIRQVQSTVTNALKETDKMSAANVAKLREFSKAINQTENAIKTIQKYGSGNRKMLDFLGSEEQLQRQARSIRNVQDYRRSLEQAGTTSQALKARINELDKTQVDAATRGKKSLDAQILQQQKLRDALKEYETIQRKIGNISVKSGLLSNESFGKLDQFVNRLQNADNIFTRMAGDRRVFNFQPGLDQLKLATAQMEQQLRLLAQQDKANGRLAEKTQQRARDLLATTPRMEQAKIGSAGRQGFLADNYIGMNTDDFQRRLDRATSLYSIAKRQLQQEVEKGTNADTDRLNTLMNRYTNLQRIIGQTGRAYQSYSSTTISETGKMENRLERVVESYNKLGRVERKVLVDDVKIAIRESSALLKQFDKELNDVGSKANSAKPIQSKLSQSVQGLLGDGGLALGARVGIYSIAASGIYGVLNAAREAGRFVVEFEDKLAQLQAISGSTNTQMEQLSRVILDVSKSSRFSAVEIAEATVQLAQAGFSAKDLGDSLGAITNFAAASGTSVKDSVDIITGAIGAFQLQASEAGRVTDIFTAALNRSRLSSQQIAQAIQYVGTTAFEQNISLEQMVATIGSVAQAGVRAGSTLGTGFRQFLVDLANPTDKLKDQLERLGISLQDIDVKTRGLPAVLDTLKAAGFGAAQAYEGLEVRAAAFYLAAKNNISVANDLMLAESQRNVALEASTRAMDSLSAQWQRFLNILGELAADNAPLDFLKALVQIAADGAEKIGQFNKELMNLNNERAKVNTGSSELDSLLNMRIDDLALQSVQSLNQFLAETLDIGVLVGREFGILDEKTKGWGQTWLEYADSVYGANDANEALATATAEARDEAANQAQTMASVSSELTNLISKQGTLKNDTVQVAILTNQLTTRFEGLAGMLGTTANAYDNLVIALRRYQLAQGREAGFKSYNQAEAAGREFTERSNTANRQIAGIRNSAGYRNLNSSDRARLEQEFGRAGQVGYVTNSLTDLVRGFKGAGDDLVKGVTGLRDTLARRQASFGERQTALSLAGTQFARSNPRFAAFAQPVDDSQANINALTAQAAGKSEAERATIFAPLISNLGKSIVQIDAALRNTRDKGTRAALEQLREEASSAVNQAKAVVKQTSDEQKAQAKADRKAEADARRAGAAGRRAQNLFERNNLTAAQAGLRSSDRSLQAFFGNKPLSGELSAIPEFFKNGQILLEDWIKARNAVKDAQIAKGDMNADQIAQMVEATNDEIAAKTKQTYQQYVSVIDSALTSFIATQAKNIENEFRNSTLSDQRRLSTEQGRASGLTNELYNIPEYTRVIQGRRVGLAQQALNQSTYKANSGRITSNEELIQTLMERRAGIESQMSGLDTKSEQYSVLKGLFDKWGTEMEQLRITNEDLVTANQSLEASINADSLKPKTFGEGLSQAAQAFGIQNNTGIGLNERIINSLGDAIENVHGSFQKFFTDIMTGTANVGQAFGGMAKAVVAAIGEMAAKAVATQIFGLLLSFIPGSQNFSNLGPSTPIISAQSTWNGGSIGGKTPKRLIGGGRVSEGLPTRDSTLVHAAEGEFMIRRSSVESIGERLLSDMNNRGAAALKGLGDKNIVMPQSQLQSNVYVVLPEEQPTLGPADVLATVSRDILRGGATKQLIKQVAAGG